MFLNETVTVIYLAGYCSSSLLERLRYLKNQYIFISLGLLSRVSFLEARKLCKLCNLNCNISIEKKNI